MKETFMYEKRRKRGMQKTLLFAILTVAFAFAACQPAQTPQEPIHEPPQPPPVPEDPSFPGEETQEEEPVTPDDEEADPLDMFRSDETPTAAVTGDAAELKERVEEKARNGYSYVYSEVTALNGLKTNRIINDRTVYVRDGQISIEYLRRDFNERQQRYISRVLTDEEFSEAVAWCDDRCSNQSTFNVDADDYEHAPAAYWIEHLESAEKGQEQTRGGVHMIEVQAVVKGQNVTMWVQSFSGLPVQVITEDMTYNYDALYTGVSPSLFETPEA